MKFPQFDDAPDWLRWSNGRKLTREEMKAWRRTWKYCREDGESPRAFFERVRAPIEEEYARRNQQ